MFNVQLMTSIWSANCLNWVSSCVFVLVLWKQRTTCYQS